MNFKDQYNGFTLIEIIASLVLIGTIATFATLGIAKVIEGYVFAKDTANVSLKAQAALTRLAKEFSHITTVQSGSDTELKYSIIKNGSATANRILSWSATPKDPLTLDGNILVDKVNDFSLTYQTSYSDSGDHTWNGGEKIISVSLKLTGADNIVSAFSIKIAPRNL